MSHKMLAEVSKLKARELPAYLRSSLSPEKRASTAGTTTRTSRRTASRRSTSSSPPSSSSPTPSAGPPKAATWPTRRPRSTAAATTDLIHEALVLGGNAPGCAR
eukprot:SM000120S25709  [mRNA]  locus=s120:216567:217103:- [translate_table: standard]